MFTPPNLGARARRALALACFWFLPAAAAAQNPTTNLITFHSDRDGDWEIYVMNADGSGQRALTANTVEDRDPVWSPDGRTIAFTSRRDGNIELYLIRADGTGLRRLTNDPATDFSPTFSPDGRQIAFVSDRLKQTDIYVVNADGTNLRRFTTHELDEWRPMWSPDGKEIAFMSGRDAGQSDGSGEIYVRDAAGRQPERRLMKATKRVNAFSWSPDSTKLVFFGVGARKFEIGVVDRTGANEKNLSAIAASSLDTEPAWSPAGDAIAFLGAGPSGQLTVHVMAADGTARRPIGNGEAPSMGPLSWSADGGRVMHSQLIAGNWEVVISAVDGPVTRLTSNRAADQMATFARVAKLNKPSQALGR
jgi:Tol biopolymer transport system component